MSGEDFRGHGIFSRLDDGFEAYEHAHGVRPTRLQMSAEAFEELRGDLEALAGKVGNSITYLGVLAEVVSWASGGFQWGGAVQLSEGGGPALASWSPGRSWIALRGPASRSGTQQGSREEPVKELGAAKVAEPAGLHAQPAPRKDGRPGAEGAEVGHQEGDDSNTAGAACRG